MNRSDDVMNKVHSLPKRNGNSGNSGKVPVAEKFTAYLKGMETQHWESNKKVAQEFTAYLKGMETTQARPGFPHSARIHSLPKRNGNAPAASCAQWPRLVHSLPKRNGNRR